MTSLTKFFASPPKHLPDLFFLSLIGYQIMMTWLHNLPLCRGLFPHLLIGHQGTLLIINSLLLIIMSGIHSLTMARSLNIEIKPCSILLKSISLHIITLYLFFHCTFVLISTSPYVKIYQFRDYFMLIIVQLTWQWPIIA